VTDSKVFVIVVNWNGKETLWQCLTSIQQYTLSPFEVVVVDNGSADRSADMVRKDFPQTHLIANNGNLGFSKANNQGLRYAAAQGANYFLILNNDVFISQGDWLARMVGSMEADLAVGMVGCKLVFPDGRIQHAGGSVAVSGARHIGEGEVDKRQYDKAQLVDYVTGAALLTKKEVIAKIGLLDEGFTPLYCEDTDWCLRAAFCGYKTLYTPNPTLVHKHGDSAKKLRQRNSEFYFKRSWIRFFLLNFTAKNVAKRLLCFELPEVFACFFDRTSSGALPMTMRLDYDKLTLLWKAWMTNLGNLREILQKRRQRFSCRKI
jgi:GT2 family glycosyltransferase